MVSKFVVALALVGCGDNLAAPDAALPARVEVALVPSPVTRDVDVLFVIQDSPSVLDKQTVLKNAMPRFFEELGAGPGGLPNLHIGVVSQDLGTSSTNDSQPAPNLGSGPGSCSGNGKAGVLQTNGTNLLAGNFIRDVANGDGTRSTNYTGSIADVLAAIASLGAGGCSFEQPLRAAHVALAGQPANTGFYRPSAALAIILLSEDEECSVASTTIFSSDTNVLGPLSTFRCIRYGVTCDVGGQTPDDMNVVGPKSGCHANATSSVVAAVAPLAEQLAALKPDPRSILFAAIAGDKQPVDVTLTSSAGIEQPSVAASCSSNGPNGVEQAQPGVRIAEAAESFRRHLLSSSCKLDDTQAVSDIARQIRNMVGDGCLSTDIARPADCEVFDELLDGTRTRIPPCDATRAEGCYSLVEDPSCRPSQQLRIDVRRSAPALPDSMVSVWCPL